MIRKLSAAAAGLPIIAGLALAVLRAQSPGAEDPLIGVWAGETTFGSPLSGELTVARKDSAWRAALSQAETKFPVSGKAVRFEFPDNGGRFRGALTEGERTISGFWIQPAATDPAGIGQAFASPLTLHRTGAGSWSGRVEPLEDRFRLYLRIFRSSDGGLLAAFRNPERNSRGGAARFRVRRDGDAVRFNARPDETMPEILVDGSLSGFPVRLRVHWGDIDRDLDLYRYSPSDSRAAGFFPRPPGENEYEYRRPPENGDGWKTARAADAGMDEEALARSVRRLIGTDPSDRRPALIHSLLVAHRGRLVLEEYFFGFERETPHDLRSAGKTFASVLLGAVMRRGAAISPETRIYDLLSRNGPFANPDPRKSTITLAELMTHTSGLACDDNDDDSPGKEERMQSQRAQPDWWKYTLDLPSAHDPGSRYAYCSAGMNLAGAALTTATKSWLPELFDRAVARPLGFSRYYWNLMPNGEGYLGGGAYLRPRDFLKLGQAYLDGGVWRGHRLVDAAWIAQSTSKRVEISETTTGLDSAKFSESYSRGADGYAWHLSELRSGDRSYRAYAASGNGGQLLIVVPELDLAVVFTAGNYGQGGIWGRFRDEIVPREIIPAIRTRPS